MSVSALTSASQQSTSSGARLLQLLQGATQTDSKQVKSHGKPPPKGDHPPPPPPSNTTGSDAKSLFDALGSADTNGDGTLSADEIAQSAASGLMSDDFSAIDSDGDGQLNETEVGSYESAANEVLGAMGSPATIGQIVASASQSDGTEMHGMHGPHHGPPPPNDASFGMDETTATVVADALTSVLSAMDANKDSSLSSDELTSYLASNAKTDSSPKDAAGSLAESIVKAMAQQSATASNQDLLAQQYTSILQALSG